MSARYRRPARRHPWALYGAHPRLAGRGVFKVASGSWVALLAERRFRRRIGWTDLEIRPNPLRRNS